MIDDWLTVYQEIYIYIAPYEILAKECVASSSEKTHVQGLQ